MRSKKLVRNKHIFKILSRAILSSNVYILMILLVIILVVGGIFVPNIFKFTNLMNVLRIASILGIVAIGEALVLLTGEFDLSVGSIMSLSLVTGGLFLYLGSVPALLITFLTGLTLGAINGIAVAKGKVMSLFMTLGTLSVYGALALIMSRGQAVYLYDLSYILIGRGYVFGIPTPVIIFIIITLICFLFLNFTSTGRYIYYTGANTKAALFSGVGVNNIKILVFSICGLCAALAGPMYASQTQRITPILGVGFELSAFVIAVLGGTDLWGGKGSVLGVSIGALIYGFLVNILALSGIGTYIEQVLKGVLLIIVVIVFQNIKRR